MDLERDVCKPLPVTSCEQALAERYARGRVVVIDDDPDILDAVRALVEFKEYVCETYESALSYLRLLDRASPRFPGPSCLLCDVKLPEVDGLELLRRLRGKDDIPILLMSGASGAPEAVSAFHNGALDFLIKPMDMDVLLGKLNMALRVSAERQRQREYRLELRRLFGLLTEREREVAFLVAAGARNLEIAETMGVALRTVKRHRHQVMEKLEIETLVDLVHVIDEVVGEYPELSGR